MALMRKAAIGIGSNSMRLLVADVTDGRIVSVHRGRQDVRPFAGLAEGRFTQEILDQMVRVARGFHQEALALGSEETLLIATSATREAANAQELIQRLWAEAGLHLRVITGEEEACLSFVGGALPGHCGLVDIGGGSTELTVGMDKKPLACISMEIGAVRLLQTRPCQGVQDALDLAEELRQEILAGWRSLGQPLPKTWVGVGGTATNLAAMERGVMGPTEGHVLKKDFVQTLLLSMAEMTTEQIAQLPGIRPKRADIAVPGAVIVLACMNALEMDELLISEGGNLAGCILGLSAGL